MQVRAGLWPKPSTASRAVAVSCRPCMAPCMRAGLPKEVANEQNPEIKGVKSVLFGILRAAPGALTSAQIWESAEVEPSLMRHSSSIVCKSGRPACTP